MIEVLIGGCGSGKSEFAENVAVQLNRGELVYIATMQPFDEESKVRVNRHRSMRQCKNFKTIESYTGLSSVKLAKNTTALLECMSNLVANEMFSEDGAKENTLVAIKQGIHQLIEQSEHLLIVTNNIFEDGYQYDEETMRYMKQLGEINTWLCQTADRVVEVVHGIPIEVKSIETVSSQEGI
jgi:adenosylcobinamide kinase/adenosylcobinamide-phosphate guanylyltransferase